MKRSLEIDIFGSEHRLQSFMPDRYSGPDQSLASQARGCGDRPAGFETSAHSGTGGLAFDSDGPHKTTQTCRTVLGAYRGRQHISIKRYQV